MPFANEAGEVLNAFKDASWWGKEVFPHTGPLNYLINGTALMGIMWNVLTENEIYGKLSAFLKGAGLIGFSFLLPQYAVGKVQDVMSGMLKNNLKIFDYKNSKHGYIGKFLAGVVAIVILESCVKLWDAYVIPFVEDIAEWWKKKHGDNESTHKTQLMNDETEDGDRRRQYPHEMIGGLTTANITG
ncbi:MAG TPA: hypothetical protein V6C96_02725, partial [Vampirovibrionales bacterium]